MVKNIFALVVVSFFAFITGLPLLHKGLPPTHDGEYHVVRFYEFDRALRDGNWYPRWAADLNNGYGVPLFNYVYPLPNYVASFFHSFGISFIDAFKLNMFFATIIGSAFFYLWAKQFWGQMGGVVSSVFYTFSPYHFVEVYIRGSVGEVWALAFFPAFLWSATKFFVSKRRFYFLLSSVFLALVIFSHNILALMFFFFALSYVVFLILQGKEKKYLMLNTLCIILIGLGLSAIFWLPALLERNLVKGLEIFDVVAHFPDLYQLLIPSWGSGFSGEGAGSSLSFQIGIANLLAALLSSLLVFIYKKKNKNSVIVLFFIFLFFVIFFLMLKVSLPIWQTVPFMNYFQFPWRLLSLEILVTSFLAGSIVQIISQTKLNKLKPFIALCLIALAFLLGIGYTKPAHYLHRDDNYYISRPNFIDGTNSPGNAFNTIYFKGIPKKEKEKITFIKGKGSVETKEIKAESYLFNLKVDSESKIQVNTAYFPGWSVFVNGADTKTDLTGDGLFSFYLSKGNHKIEVRLVNTPLRNFVLLCFFTSGAIIIVLFIKVLFATIKR